MQLYHFLAVILSLSLGSLPASHQSFGHAASFALLLILAWWMLCYLMARLVGNLVDQGEVSVEVGYEWFDRQTECLRWLSLGLVVLCLGGFGLGRNLDQLPWVDHSLAAQSIVLLSPAIAMMIGLSGAEYLFAARLGLVPSGPLATAKAIATSLRCNVGWLIAPILGFMAVTDLASLTSFGEQVPAWVGWAGLIIAIVVGIPLLVRRVFTTKPIDDATRRWIETVITAAGVRRCKIVVWDTGGQTHNAMIAGVLGRFRVLMLSDRLVQDLSREELAMVILHEVAHAKRFHVPLRIVSLAPVWLIGAGLERCLDQESVATWVADWSGIIASAFSILATVLILRWVSYRSEFDADSIACREAPNVAKSCPGVPSTQSDARRHLASALLLVTADHHASRNPTWLHPGIADRIAAFSTP